MLNQDDHPRQRRDGSNPDTQHPLHEFARLRLEPLPELTAQIRQSRAHLEAELLQLLAQPGLHLRDPLFELRVEPSKVQLMDSSQSSLSLTSDLDENAAHKKKPAE